MWNISVSVCTRMYIPINVFKIYQNIYKTFYNLVAEKAFLSKKKLSYTNSNKISHIQIYDFFMNEKQANFEQNICHIL